MRPSLHDEHRDARPVTRRRPMLRHVERGGVERDARRLPDRTRSCRQLDTVDRVGLKHFDIKQEVFYADFNWNLILKLINNKIKFTDIPKYPEVRRDLALLVDNSVAFDTIYNIARQTEKGLLKDINLFDVYEGKNLPEGKKSYAVSFTLQDNTKTLTDEQIDKIMIKLQKNLESEAGASLRQ